MVPLLRRDLALFGFLVDTFLQFRLNLGFLLCPNRLLLGLIASFFLLINQGLVDIRQLIEHHVLELLV